MHHYRPNRRDRRRAASQARRQPSQRISVQQILDHLNHPSQREFTIGGEGWGAEARRLFAIYRIPFTSHDGDVTVDVPRLPVEQRAVLAKLVFCVMNAPESN